MPPTTTAPANRFATGANARPGAAPVGGEGAKPGGEGEAAAKKSKAALFKSKKFLIAVVALLAVGGGAYKMLVPTKVGPPTGGDVVALDPLTLNLADGHYLKVAVSVQLVQGKATATDFKSAQAAQLVIQEFSDRSVDALSSNAARTRLSADLLAKLKKAYDGEVFDLYLTQFVTQ